MKTIRRFVFTAVFLVAAFLMVHAARANSDFFYMLFPAITREIQGVLSAITQGLDYVLWQRLLLVLLLWAVVSLILDIILQENLLRWVSGVTVTVSFLLCLYVLMGGLNVFAPSVASDMGLSADTGYTVEQLQQAAEYYRDQADEYAAQVDRTADGQTAPQKLEVLAAQVDSGLHNMTPESYVFGGDPGSIKALGWKALIPAPGVVMPLTGEICIDPGVEAQSMPFFLTQEAARQLSVARCDDSAFVAVLACMASDSPLFRYSGALMGYRLCMQALEAQDSSAAYKVASGVSQTVQTDLDAAAFLPQTSLGEKLMHLFARGKADEQPDAAAMLVAWHEHLLHPEDDTQDSAQSNAPTGDADTQSTGDAETLPDESEERPVAA